MMLTALALCLLASSGVRGGDIPGYTGGPDATDPQTVHYLASGVKQDFGKLIVQDYQGRMKPVDTLARELVRKITKRFSVDGTEPVDTYLDWLARPRAWWNKPVLRVSHPGLRTLLGMEKGATHIAPAALFDAQGNYRLEQDVDLALRTADRDRSSLQRKLIALDERLNLFYLSIQGRSLRIFPVPGDRDRAWVGWDGVSGRMGPKAAGAAFGAWRELMGGLRAGRGDVFARGVDAAAAFQQDHGAAVLPSGAALKAELILNRLQPFVQLVWVYAAVGILLLSRFALGLVRPRTRPALLKAVHGTGFVLLAAACLGHLGAFILRWMAAGRAPLSNGYETLVFVALVVAAAGMLHEARERTAVVGGVASLLAFLVLGTSMMSFFDPAIGLLMPVLNSYWLNIHVTVITASYGFLGLGAMVGAVILLLHLAKGPRRTRVYDSILRLDRLLMNINLAGLALLTVGTLLGGVWANESWGRYWGWDPKESWSLVSILVYTAVSHLRLAPALGGPWALAAGSFAGISTVVMTFFGVNYFLTGLHSYAQGSAQKVPGWVWVLAGAMILLLALSFLADRRRGWGAGTPDAADGAPGPNG